MKIKLLISRAGVDFVQNRGDIVTVSDKEGLSMIAAGQAEALGKTERATSKKAKQKAVKVN